jgi:hypothetical protein
MFVAQSAFLDWVMPEERAEIWKNPDEMLIFRLLKRSDVNGIERSQNLSDNA